MAARPAGVRGVSGGMTGRGAIDGNLREARMKLKRMGKFLLGGVLPAPYELLPDGSGMGTRERRRRLTDWAGR